MNSESTHQVQGILIAARDLKEQKLVAAAALLQDCVRLRQDYQRRSRDQAPDHNLIRLLDAQRAIARSEVGLHSPFLADLLDPLGTHGQGGVFLRAFFRTLSKHRASLSMLEHTVIEPTSPGEWVIGRERERIDISIRNRRVGLLMFIENKIGAYEQPDQLTRYHALLNRQSSCYSCRLLLYLHPRAKGPPRTGVPDICLTYEDDIVPWLRSCASAGPEHVRGNVRQYIEIISDL